MAAAAAVAAVVAAVGGRRVVTRESSNRPNAFLKRSPVFFSLELLKDMPELRGEQRLPPAAGERIFYIAF